MTIQLGSLSLGWREILLAAVLMLGVYMLFVAWLMRRLRRHALPKPAPVEPTVQAAAAGVAAYAATAELEDVPGEEDKPPTESPPARTETDSEAPDAAMDASPGVNAELAQMREELDALRAEFAALRSEVQQEAAQIKAAQSVSPLYSDAMQMASAGHGAAVIAERCGISRAEAELVVALVKSQG